MLEALPRVRRFAVSLTGNRHDADDLLQNTVERVLQGKVPDGAQVLKWMFRVCRNLWIDELRSREVRGRAATTLAEESEDAGYPASAGASPVDAVYLEQVQAAAATLSEEQRAVLSLVAIEGFSYREAAETLEVPIGTVMSRLARARAALADLMPADGPPADGPPTPADAGPTENANEH
jgi:RNA polymerase sigma factor (sigma-70 family)